MPRRDAPARIARLGEGGREASLDVANEAELLGCERVVAPVEDGTDRLEGHETLALKLANDTAYGLSSAVLTNDLQLAMKFAMELDAGMVHINGPTVHDEATVPFGGVKDSGSGREGGHWSMDELTETKWITIQMGRRQYPF